MTTVRKIAISIPEKLLLEVDKESAKAGTSRSEVFRSAVSDVLRRRHEEALVHSYVKGYVDQPESEEETALASATLGSLAEAPWE